MAAVAFPTEFAPIVLNPEILMRGTLNPNPRNPLNPRAQTLNPHLLPLNPFSICSCLLPAAPLSPHPPIKARFPAVGIRGFGVAHRVSFSRIV